MARTALEFVTAMGIFATASAAVGALVYGAASTFELLDLVCNTQLVPRPPGRQTKDALRGAATACAIAGVLSVAAAVCVPEKQ
jgi:hypothetical protein